MMKSTFVNSLIFVFLVVFQMAYTQGPIDGYMKGKENLDAALGFNLNRSNTYYGKDNQTFNLPYNVEILSFFAQYGLFDQLDVVGSLPFIFGPLENKFQDMGLFLKYRPLHADIGKNGKLGTILSIGYSFPASDYQTEVTGALGQRAKQVPLRLVTQYEINGWFFNVTGIYSFRTDELSDETIASALDENPDFVISKPANSSIVLFRLGRGTRKHFFEIFSEHQTTFGGVNFENDVFKPSQLYGVDFWKIGGTYYYDVETNGLAVNMSYIPTGRNIGNIVSVGLSFIFKYRKNE